MDVVEEAIPGSELTVERVRTEVRALTERIAAKQWEVQLMVGSRYHELIDSADSVVSMYRSCKRLQLSLGDLKENLHSIGQMKPAAQLAPPDDRKFVDARSRPDTLMQSDVVFMLHAPTEIWSSIDRRELLPATRAYLKAKRIAAAATAMQSSDDEVVKRMQSVVLRQWACVSDLSKAIKDGVHELLGNQDVVGTEAHAAGVGALCLVEGLSVQQALAVYLEARSLWLRDDFSSSLESLDGDVETVQLKLTRSVQALSRTLVDTYRIFAHPHLSSHLKLDDVALPSVGRAAVAEALTQWLSRHIEETYRRSQSMLKLVRTSNELAKVRQALWAEARAAAEHDGSLWKDACSSLILMDRLRSSLSRGLSMSLPFSNTSAALDLWTVLFSRSFAVLAEDLLSEALAKVKTSLVQQLESVLVTIRGEQRGRLTAVEMAWAADHMGRNLTAQVESIGRQADSLVQEGDSHASGALAVSLRTQTLRLLAHVVAYLRVLATSLAEDDQVDGLLIEVRLAWYLSRHLGTSLLDEAPPAGPAESAAGGQPSSLRSSSARGEATIDFVQLESAFTIADMRGAGVLSQEELKDALDTIGLGGSDGGMPSCTLPEFALLCSPVLEERCPSRFLREALEAVFRQGLAAWAAVAVRQLATPLRSAVGSMAGKAGVTDALWRGRHPGWEEKLLLQEDEAGGTLEDRVWLPTHVSPWLSVYLFSLSTELSRVTQSRDCLEPGLGGDACLMEAFRHSLVRRARAELETCLTSIKPAALCEAAVLQCALDHLFLHHWLQQEVEEEGGAGEGAMLPGWSAVQQQLDPINYQMYEPTLLEAVRAQSAASALILTFLLQRTGPPGKAGLPAASHARALSSTGRRAKSMSEDLSHSHNGGASSSSSNTIPLVAAVPRFTLLPVVVEASTAASTRLSSPPRDAHHRKPSGGSAFGFNFSPDGATGPGGMGGKGGAAGGVGHAATVLSSFSSLSALGNQAASTATSFLSRATSSKRS